MGPRRVTIGRNDFAMDGPRDLQGAAPIGQHFGNAWQHEESTEIRVGPQMPEATDMKRATNTTAGK
jgi:hypothetical protein